MKSHVIRVLAAVAAFPIVVAAADADKPAKSAKAKAKPFTATCPVMGTPAVKESSIAFLSKKLYFCCPGCPDQFDPTQADHRTKAHFQLAQTGQITQVACPIGGHDPDETLFVKINGVKVMLCCEGCKEKLAKMPAEKQVEAVFAKIDKHYSLQTTCPVSGKPIRPEYGVKYKGKMVYLHGGPERRAFQADPAKYLSKLPQFAKPKAGK